MHELLRQSQADGEVQPKSNAYLERLDSFKPTMLNDGEHTLISLFCGGGGLDLGLGFAGFKTLLANDISPSFVETVTRNLPGAKACVMDAQQLTGEQLLQQAEVDTIDLVAAGPPCQSFSILGQRGALDDPRGKLALKYFELVADVRPKAFIFENVSGLLTVNRGEDWKRLLAYAREMTGYILHPATLNAVAFGIPQFRERVFVVGFRENVPFEFPAGPTGDKFRSASFRGTTGDAKQLGPRAPRTGPQSQDQKARGKGSEVATIRQGLGLAIQLITQIGSTLRVQLAQCWSVRLLEVVDHTYIRLNLESSLFGRPHVCRAFQTGSSFTAQVHHSIGK